MTTNAKQTKRKRKLSIAEYLKVQYDASGLTQEQIADELGIKSQNMISLITRGKIKIPMERIVPLAKVLKIDPKDLLLRAIEEYQPEIYSVYEEILNQPILTNSEIEIIEQVRAANEDKPLDALSEQRQIDALQSFISSFSQS